MKVLKYINHCFFWSFVISLFMMIWFDDPAIGKACGTSALVVVILSVTIGKIKMKKDKKVDEAIKEIMKDGVHKEAAKSVFKQRLQAAQKAQSEAKKNKRDY